MILVTFESHCWQSDYGKNGFGRRKMQQEIELGFVDPTDVASTNHSNVQAPAGSIAPVNTRRFRKKVNEDDPDERKNLVILSGNPVLAETEQVFVPSSAPEGFQAATEVIPLRYNNRRDHTDDFEQVVQSEFVAMPASVALPVREDIALIEHKFRQSEHSEVIRYIFRDQSLARLLIMPYTRCCYPKEAILFNKVGCQGRAAILNTRQRRYLNTVNSYLEGAIFFMEKVWPLALIGMMLHDMIELYRYPSLRFGNSLWAILLGTSTNALSFATHMGSDVPTATTYWVAFSILISAPMAFGLGNMALHCKLSRSMDDVREYLLVNPAVNNMSWLNPLSKRRRLLEHAVNTILYCADKNYHPDEASRADFLLNCILNLVEGRASLAKLYGYSALATIVDKLYDRNIEAEVAIEQEVLETSPLSKNREQHQIRRNIFNTAFSRLHSKSFGKYYLWTTGFVGSTKRQLCAFAAYGSVRLIVRGYFYYRYFLFLISKIIEASNYLDSKMNCDKEGKIYLYNPNTGYLECTICGDDQRIFDPYTSQGCMSGILAASQQVDEIINMLEKSLKFTANFSEMSLVNQQWQSWKSQDFIRFINDLATVRSIEVFNLSSGLNAISFPQNFNKSMALANLNQKVCVRNWDLKNQKLAEAMMPLVTSLKHNQCTKTLNISGNELTDEIMHEFVEIFNTTVIETLIVDNNLISSRFLTELAGVAENSQLTVLSVQQSQLGQGGIDALGQLLNRNENLNTIILSNCDLSGLDFTSFGLALQKYSRLSVNLNQCNLASFEIIALAPYLNTTLSINLSDNIEINKMAAESLLSALQGGPAAELILQGMAFDRQTILALGNYLPLTRIHTLDVSRCAIENQDFIDFFRHISNSSIRCFKVAQTAFGQNVGNQLAAIIQETNMTFNEFDYSLNNLSDDDGALLINALCANTTLIQLKLSGNNLASNSAAAIVDNIDAGCVAILHVGSNNFNSTDMSAIIAALPGSNLQTLSYPGNRKNLSNDVEIGLASRLLKNLPDTNGITAYPLNRDLARWIHDQGTPQTALQYVDASHNQVNSLAARALCNVIKAARITPDRMLLANAPITYPCFFNHSNQPSARLSASTASPNALPNGSMLAIATTIPVFGLIVFLLLLYYWWNKPVAKNSSQLNQMQP